MQCRRGELELPAIPGYREGKMIRIPAAVLEAHQHDKQLHDFIVRAQLAGFTMVVVEPSDYGEGDGGILLASQKLARPTQTTLDGENRCEFLEACLSIACLAMLGWFADIALQLHQYSAMCLTLLNCLTLP